ncbi:hypothetical protein AB0F88_00815 [Streptosporangium sp. NPDC023963]|uniref:hypothetical protein n=1 Tax=Streptosporangium sp. NPDC023963 TaxID=3155608 RepID=UPI003447E3D9
MTYASSKQQANLRAVFCVAAEICHRGAWADVVIKPPSLVMAGREKGQLKVAIRVNMRRSGDWQPGLPKDSDPKADFRILVDTEGDKIPDDGDYYIVSETEFRRWVLDDHERNTRPYGGQRALGGNSNHKRVTISDARKLDRGWDALGIF